MNLYASNKTIADKQIVFFDFADQNYLRTMGLQLIAGHNFEQEVFTNTNMLEDSELHDFGKQVILNEEAARELGFDPYKAPGQYVSHLHNGIVYTYQVVGVVKDYHYFSLHATIGPCAIMNVNPMRCSTVVAKIEGKHAEAAVQYALSQWKKLNPDTPFQFDFLNNIFQSDYIQDQRQQQMMEIFSGLAILISCLGLLGLITYSVAQKMKEIAVRKVIGASVKNIVILFYTQYFRLILLANLVALPVAWYVMHTWLVNFPYHVNMSWWMFLVPILSGVIVTFCTIAFKTIKAANANPVDSLRAE
jgi:putative ABC transport system permease protein